MSTPVWVEMPVSEDTSPGIQARPRHMIKGNSSWSNGAECGHALPAIGEIEFFPAQAQASKPPVELR